MTPNDHDTPASVALAALRPAADNLRSDLGDLASLRASIKAQGVLQPLLITPIDPTLIAHPETGGDVDDAGVAYVVVDGHRRYAAALAEGLKVVPALIRRMSDTDRVEAMLTTAVEKRDLLPSEEADGYRRLAELGKSQRDIAALVGVNQSHVSKTMALATLPDQAKAELDAGRITRETAHEIASLPEGTQRKLYSGNKLPDHYEINEALRKQRLSEKRSAAESKAREKGLRVVDAAEVHWTMNAGGAKGVWLAGLQETGREGVRDSEHEAMRCHAVAWRDNTMVAVCTDPGIHPEKPQPTKRTAAVAKPAPPRQESAKDKAAREEAEAEQRRRVVEIERIHHEEAQARATLKIDYDRRLAFIKDMVAAPKAPDVFGVAAAVVADICELSVENAVALLAIPEADDWELDELSDHLAIWVGEDHRRQMQMVYAFALAELRCYDQVSDIADPWERRLQRVFWTHLTGHGYEMSDLERSWLPKPETPEVGASSGGDRGETVGSVSAIAAGPREGTAPPSHDTAADEDLPDEPEFDVDGDGQGEYVEPDWEATVYKRIGIGDIVNYGWECGCGAEGDLVDTRQAAEEASAAHMLEAHDLVPVD